MAWYTYPSNETLEQTLQIPFMSWVLGICKVWWIFWWENRHWFLVQSWPAMPYPHSNPEFLTIRHIHSSWYRDLKSNSLLFFQWVIKLEQFSAVTRWTSAPFISWWFGETRNKSRWTLTVSCWTDSVFRLLESNHWSFGSRADFTSSIAKIKFFKQASEEKTTWKSGDCS